METVNDRLYDLLPTIYRLKDAGQDQALRALLHIIAEQVDLLDADIQGLYENWFIETCQDWVVPYIGDLVGVIPPPGTLVSEEPMSAQARLRSKVLTPRREVANTIYYRRRKGTLALLELLANHIAGWPGLAVEKFQYDQKLPVSLAVVLKQLSDVGWNNLWTVVDRPVKLFVFPLKNYPVTKTPVYHLDNKRRHYTFSILGNDSPLVTRWHPEEDPVQIAGKMNLPLVISQEAYQQTPGNYYGEGKSLCIYTGADCEHMKLVHGGDIAAVDLQDWKSEPEARQVLLDPELGRMKIGHKVFESEDVQRQKVWVSYHYAFSEDLGGGEYHRKLFHPKGTRLYYVRKGYGGSYQTIKAALEAWAQDQPKDALIEIQDSNEYSEPFNLKLMEGQSLQIRAANRCRPVIRQLDWMVDGLDSLYIKGQTHSRFRLDGILLYGRGITAEGNLEELVIHHSTLVPGWELEPDCEPKHGKEASLLLEPNGCHVRIDHSILGSIQVHKSTDDGLPQAITLEIQDSILDATGVGCDEPSCIALSSDDNTFARVALTMRRCTVIGKIMVREVPLAEDSIFYDTLRVARRQVGCIRFSYVKPGSVTPQRYRCQPDLKEQEARNHKDWDKMTEEEQKKKIISIREIVRPNFLSLRYGEPTYCRLKEDPVPDAECPVEISRGASDGSEMGAFHTLFNPLKEDNLLASLKEYIPSEYLGAADPNQMTGFLRFLYPKP